MQMDTKDDFSEDTSMMSQVMKMLRGEVVLRPMPSKQREFLMKNVLKTGDKVPDSKA